MAFAYTDAGGRSADRDLSDDILSLMDDASQMELWEIAEEMGESVRTITANIRRIDQLRIREGTVFWCDL